MLQQHEVFSYGIAMGLYLTCIYKRFAVPGIVFHIPYINSNTFIFFTYIFTQYLLFASSGPFEFSVIVFVVHT